MASDPLELWMAQQQTRTPHGKHRGMLDEIDALDAALAARETPSVPAPHPSATAPSAWRKRQPGPLPMPQPSLAQELGQSAAEVGRGGLASLMAIPVAAGDALTMGLLPRAEEAAGLVPSGGNQQIMAASPVGTFVGQTAGLAASALAGPLRGIGAGVGAALGKVGVMGPLQRALARNVVPAAAYSGLDATARGGDVGQVGEAMGAGAVAGMLPSVAEAQLGRGATAAAAEGAPPANESATVSRSLTRKAQQLLDDSVKGAAIKGTRKLEINRGLVPGGEDLAGLEGDALEASGGARAVAAAATRQGLDRDLLGTVPQFTRALLARRAVVGREIGTYTTPGNLPSDGVPLVRVLQSLQNAKSRTAPDTPEFDALTARMKSLLTAYKPADTPAYAVRIPLWQMQDLAEAAAKQGYGAEGRTFVDPKEPARIARTVHRAIREPLYDEINTTLAAHPELGSPERFAALRRDYTDLSGLADIAIAARPKAYLGRPGLIESVQELGRSVSEHRVGTGAGAAAYGTGLFLGGGHGLGHALGTAMAAPVVARPVLQHLDNRLAQLVLSARQGLPAPTYGALAERLGVDPATAGQIYRTFRAGVLGVSAQSPTGATTP